MPSWLQTTGVASGVVALVSTLVLLYVRSLRSSYDARVLDLKEYSADLIAQLKSGQDVTAKTADSLDKVLAQGQVTETLLRAIQQMLVSGKANAA